MACRPARVFHVKLDRRCGATRGCSARAGRSHRPSRRRLPLCTCVARTRYGFSSRGNWGGGTLRRRPSPRRRGRTRSRGRTMRPQVTEKRPAGRGGRAVGPMRLPGSSERPAREQDVCGTEDLQRDGRTTRMGKRLSNSGKQAHGRIGAVRGGGSGTRPAKTRVSALGRVAHQDSRRRGPAPALRDLGSQRWGPEDE